MYKRMLLAYQYSDEGRGALSECDDLAIRKDEGVRLFFVKTPIGFGTLGELARQCKQNPVTFRHRNARDFDVHHFLIFHRAHTCCSLTSPEIPGSSSRR
jgi:hypothetical protein